MLRSSGENLDLVLMPFVQSWRSDSDCRRTACAWHQQSCCRMFSASPWAVRRPWRWRTRQHPASFCCWTRASSSSSTYACTR